MDRVQVFDVNETLLDLTGIDPHFERGLRRRRHAPDVVRQIVQSALVATVTGTYRPCREIGLAALAMTAEQVWGGAARHDRDAIAIGMRRLPAHPEDPKR